MSHGMIVADGLVQGGINEHPLLPIEARFRPVIHDSTASNASVSRLSRSTPSTIV